MYRQMSERSGERFLRRQANMQATICKLPFPMPCKSLSGNPISPGVAAVAFYEGLPMTTGAGPEDSNGAELSVITPVHNESKNIEVLLARLVPVLERCTASFEIVFIDDGSTDATLKLLGRPSHGPSHSRAFAEPEFRQGDRHSGGP